MGEHSLVVWNVKSHFSKLVRALCPDRRVLSWALGEKWLEWWEIQNLSCETGQKEFGGFHWRRKDLKEYEVDTKYLDDCYMAGPSHCPVPYRVVYVNSSPHSQKCSFAYGQGLTIPKSRCPQELYFSSISARTSQPLKNIFSCLGKTQSRGWMTMCAVGGSVNS